MTQLSQYASGQAAAVSGDQLNSFIQSCDTIAQLRAFVGLPGIMVQVRGATAAGDGGGGLFYWVAGSSGPDNNTTIIVPPAAAIGAWVQLPINVTVAATLTVANLVVALETVATSNITNLAAAVAVITALTATTATLTNATITNLIATNATVGLLTANDLFLPKLAAPTAVAGGGFVYTATDGTLHYLGPTTGPVTNTQIGPVPEAFVFALGAEGSPGGGSLSSTPIRLIFRPPYQFTVTDVRVQCSFNSGAFTVTTDVLKGVTGPASASADFTAGTSVLSTLPIMNAAGTTSLAGTPAVVNASAATATLASDQLCGIRCTFSVAPTTVNFAGLKVAVIGYKSA